MAKAAKGRKVASGFPVRLAILALLVLLGWQVWRMQDQLTAAKAQEQQLRTQVQLQQQENDALQKSIDQGGSQEEMERIARDELGLVSPGEPGLCGHRPLSACHFAPARGRESK